MNVSKQFIAVSNYNRPGIKRKNTTAVACHYIGNPGTTAQNNRDWFESLSKLGPLNEAAGKKVTKASCHYIVGLEGEIIQLIPEDEISWCTNSANGYTISIEACHPDATGKFKEATYNSYVELCADICSRWGLDPIHGGLIRHYDVTRKVCPKWFVQEPLEWKKFKEAVAASMKPTYILGWNHDSNGWWYADSEDTFFKSGFYKIKDKWYFFNEDGYAYQNQWVEYETENVPVKRWFYLDKDCCMVTGFRVIQGVPYFFNEDGAMWEGEISLTFKTDSAGKLVYQHVKE